MHDMLVRTTKTPRSWPLLRNVGRLLLGLAFLHSQALSARKRVPANIVEELRFRLVGRESMGSNAEIAKPIATVS